MSKQTNSSAILESISDAIVDVTQRVSQSVVRVGAGRWRGGTGTIWSKDGHIVTSNHVIGDNVVACDDVSVFAPDGACSDSPSSGSYPDDGLRDSLCNVDYCVGD